MSAAAPSGWLAERDARYYAALAPDDPRRRLPLLATLRDLSGRLWCPRPGDDAALVAELEAVLEAPSIRGWRGRILVDPGEAIIFAQKVRTRLGLRAYSEMRLLGSAVRILEVAGPERYGVTAVAALARVLLVDLVEAVAQEHHTEPAGQS